MEALDLVAYLGPDRKRLGGDPRELLGYHVVCLPRKSAPPFVERVDLTRVGNIEEGQAGLELRQQESRAGLLEASPELRGPLELIRVIQEGGIG